MYLFRICVPYYLVPDNTGFLVFLFADLVDKFHVRPEEYKYILKIKHIRDLIGGYLDTGFVMTHDFRDHFVQFVHKIA